MSAEIRSLSRIDWQSVVVNLRGAGLDAPTLARKVGCDVSAIYQWARGGNRQPRDWVVCLRLLDLHLDYCPDRHRLDKIAA